MTPGDTEDSRRLLDRCRQGDERAWKKLVDRYQNLVYSVARRSRLSRDDAEEVFVSTFTSLYKNLDRIDDPLALGKWLAVTASRESFRAMRWGDRHVQLSDENRSLDEILVDEETAADVMATAAAEADEVRTAVLSMDAKCRSLLSMLYLQEEADYSTVSDALSMPIGSIGPTRARCLEKLRSTLSRTGFFDEPVYQGPLTETHHSKKP